MIAHPAPPAPSCTASPPQLLSLATMTFTAMRVCALGQRREHAAIYSPVLVSYSLHSGCSSSYIFSNPRAYHTTIRSYTAYQSPTDSILNALCSVFMLMHAPLAPIPSPSFPPPSQSLRLHNPIPSPPRCKRAQSITPCEEPRPAAEL